MAKSHSFDELSTRVCNHVGCKTRIKQRLVSSENKEEQNKRFIICYKHFQSTRKFAKRMRERYSHDYNQSK